MIKETLEKNFYEYGHKDALGLHHLSVTYKDLEEKTRSILKSINDKDEKKKRVALLFDSIIDCVYGIIASVRSRHVFVPLDQSEPLNQIRKYITFVQPNIIITDEKGLGIMNEILQGEYEARKVEAYYYIDFTTIHEVSLQMNQDEAYIYFTSGTTGEPKGIIGRYESLYQFIKWEIEELSIDSSWICGQCTLPTFDPFLRDIFVPLCAGAKVILAEKSTIKNPLKLKEWITKYDVQVLHIIPSLFSSVIGTSNDETDLANLRYLLFAGEPLKNYFVKKFYAFFENTEINFYNLYGPTETTLAKFYHKLKFEDSRKENIPVGKRINQETRVDILNEEGKPCTSDEIGEIYINTQYGTLGYLNGDEQHRFCCEPKDSNRITFRTGDYGRINEEGDFEIYGRVDNQIKIRGKKIQPEEIEQRMIKFHNIDNAGVCCLTNEEGNNFLLCACIESSIEINQEELKKYLSEYLPEYKVPLLYVFIEKMPVNKNGKLDRIFIKKLLKDFYESRLAGTQEENRGNNTEDNNGKSVKEKICEIILKITEIKITNQNMDTEIQLLFDSLNYVRFLVYMEDEFDMEFSDEQLDIGYFSTLEDVVQFIEEVD